jgi:hypothetical protein
MIMGIRDRIQRVIEDLVVREISAVTKGANGHTRILLRKHAGGGVELVPDKSQEVRPMNSATAFSMWDTYTDVIAKRDNVSKSRAIDVALRTETGRELYKLASPATGADVAKLGGGTLPQGPTPMPPTARRPDPTDYASSRRKDDAEDGNAERQSRRYLTRVEQLVAGGMTPSKAHDKARAEMPDEWTAHKMMPPSHDGNAPRMRGPYESNYGGGSPYKMPTGNMSNSNVTR